MASASVMNLPFFVLPYQRSPSRWNTLVSRFTQTIPLTGGCCAVVAVLGARPPGEAGAWVCGAGGAAPAVDGRAAPAAAPNVTSGVILSIVFFGTPALARSAADVYGRPAMIFFAV